MRVMVSDGRGRQVRHLVVRAPSQARTGELCSRLGPVGDLRGRPPVDAPLRHGQELQARPGAGSDPHREPPCPAGPWLVVSSGPDAGTALPLSPGQWVTVGRDPSCELRIEDPSLSRRHLRVRLERDCVRVEDLGSTNGLSWESGAGTRSWQPEDRLLIGRSALVLVLRLPPPASMLQREGRCELVPWKRERPTRPHRELTSPASPRPRTVRRPSVWTWALPLAAALVVAVVLRMPWLLLFGLLGPTMVLGHHLGDRRAAREEHREAVAEHRVRCTEVERTAAAALRSDLAERRAEDPGLVGVAAALSTGPTTRLWECVGEPLTAVLGEAPESGAVTVDGTVLVHDRAPVVVDLGSPLAVVGQPAARDALVRSVVLQLACRHPPGELTIEVDPAHLPDTGWDLLAWLPHTRLAHGRRERGVVRWGHDLVLVDDVRQAPPGTDRVVMLGPGVALLQRSGTPDRRFDPTLLGLGPARRMARELAPVRPAPGDPTHREARQGPTRLGQLLAWPRRQEDLDGVWRRPSLRVPLGHGPDGAGVVVDLAEDGPHALVAGTTGSGKSELLRALVVALALQNPPEDLSLLLVDYKGGSSLGACAGLPHVTGLVTDLDPHLAQRVLESLQAELTRREHLLLAAGARDIREHRGPGLPRLVVVIDEFRVLAEEVPQVMDGLVRVAAVGRSLGVHLVLATQRPAGVVGADLRANVNLRIALRVRDVADSFDVLECADAAGLPEGRPGMALLRTGASAPRTVQVAVALPPADDTGDGWHVSEHTDVWAARRALDRTGPPTELPGEDPVAALGVLLSAAADARGQVPVRVWLPPLAEDLHTDPARAGAWAVADLPGEQRQPPLVWAGEHHLGIVGAARSGRSTALRSLLSRTALWRVVLDLGRSLGEGQDGPGHPRCCAWVYPDDQAHALRVLDLLLALVQERRADPGLEREPVVLAVDGWDRCVDQLGQVEAGRGVDLVQRILREGPAVGVVGLVSGDRSLLLGTMATLLPETWMLHLNDPADLMLTGLRPGQVPRHQPPGRMIRARDGVVAQVVRPDPGAPRAGEGRQVDGNAASTPPAPPLRCVPLPRRWCADGPDAWAVGGDGALPVDLPPGPMLVLGPPGSGRSHALDVLAAAAGGSALRVEGTDPPRQEPLAAALAQLTDGDLVTVDDAHLLCGTPVEDLLVDHAVRHRAPMHVAAELEGAAAAFRGLLPLLARGRTALVLHPATPGDGAVVGRQLPVGDLRVPGRGVLVHRGRATRVQVAAPTPPAGP